MKNGNLNCRITQRKVAGSTVYEGTVAIPGVTSFKLQKGRGSNATTGYSTKSALQQATRAFADRHNYGDVNFNDTSTSGSKSSSTSSTSKSRSSRSGSSSTSTRGQLIGY